MDREAPQRSRFRSRVRAAFHARADHPPCSTARLEELGAIARSEGVDLLLLPELHVRPEEGPSLRRPAGPLLLVGGSFHVHHDDGLANRAPVLTEGGHPLWSHDKRGHFRLTPSQAAQAGIECGRELCEGIVGGGALTVLDTSLGRLAVAICADVIDLDGYRRAIEDARPELLMVVAMSSDTRPFEQAADDLARLGTSTLLVNAAFERALRALAWLAVFATPDDPPTRVRWTEAGLQAWHPLQDWEANPAPIARVHPVLGLVVEIGEMMRDGKSTASASS